LKPDDGEARNDRSIIIVSNQQRREGERVILGRVPKVWLKQWTCRLQKIV